MEATYVFMYVRNDKMLYTKELRDVCAHNKNVRLKKKEKFLTDRFNSTKTRFGGKSKRIFTNPEFEAKITINVTQKGV